MYGTYTGSYSGYYTSPAVYSPGSNGAYLTPAGAVSPPPAQPASNTLSNLFAPNVALFPWLAPVFDAEGVIIGWVGKQIAQSGLLSPTQSAAVTDATGMQTGTLLSLQNNAEQGAETVYNSAGTAVGKFVKSVASTLSPLVLIALALGALWVVAND